MIFKAILISFILFLIIQLENINIIKTDDRSTHNWPSNSIDGWKQLRI